MNTTSTTYRLQSLETRLAAVEARLGIDPAVTPVAEPSPPLPEQADSAPWRDPAVGPGHAAERAATNAADLERLFGMTILGRIGIGAIVLAAGYFGQLGWAELGPAGKLAAMYLFAGVLIGFGAWLRPRVAVNYTALLWGGGASISFVAAAFGHLGYALLGPTTALVAMLASTALGQWLARLLRSEALAMVTLSGGFAAPFLVNAEASAPTALFSLAIVLHGWSAWLDRTWQWRWARLIGVAGVSMHAVAWYATHRIVFGWSDVAHLDALLLAVTAPELLQAWKARRIAASRWLSVAVAWTTVQALLLLATMINSDCRAFGALTAISLLALGSGYERRAAGLGAWAARLGSVLLPIGSLVWVRQEWLAAQSAEEHDLQTLRWLLASSMAAVTIALFAVRRWARTIEIGTTFAAVLASLFLLDPGDDFTASRALVASTAAPALLTVTFGRSVAGPAIGLALAVRTLTNGWWPVGGFGGASPEWAMLALVAGSGVAMFGALREARHRNPAMNGVAIFATIVLSAAWLGSALHDVQSPERSTMTPFFNYRYLSILAVGAGVLFVRARSVRDNLQLDRLLGGVALALGYVSGLFEVLELTTGWTDDWRAIAVSVSTLAYALCLLIVGFLKQVVALRWIGIWGMLFVAAKVVFHDLASVDTPLRVLAAGLLGGVLLGAAWIYARRKQ